MRLFRAISMHIEEWETGLVRAVYRWDVIDRRPEWRLLGWFGDDKEYLKAYIRDFDQLSLQEQDDTICELYECFTVDEGLAFARYHQSRFSPPLTFYEVELPTGPLDRRQYGYDRDLYADDGYSLPFQVNGCISHEAETTDKFLATLSGINTISELLATTVDGEV